MSRKKLMIIGIVAVAIVVIGIVLALLLTPVTTFLFGGTGDDFRNAGTCTAKRAEVQPVQTDDPLIRVVTPTPTAAPQQEETAAPEQDATATPEITPTPMPYEHLQSLADPDMLNQDIVNILLVGVDISEERLTWSGKKEWHSDVMIVLSVNFAENRADLISLPRDTYAAIPGVKGIYKMNAAINCGGGLYDENGEFNPGGLEKVCETAEWMLGGIPVEYYYAVTMTSLKQLVDAFGGLDYDLDLTYRIQGRSYTKGLQHMDGQAVLDYCRVRKAGNGLSADDVGDWNRVNRQKRILVAFFDQLKKNNLIVRIPDILDAFKGELYTNCTPAQTAALATFAYNLDRENIGMYSMSGTTTTLFHWNFLFTDQANRVDVIKKVYGVDVPQYPQYSLNYGRYRWGTMLYDRYVNLCTPLQKYVQNLIDEDDKLPDGTASADPTAAPSTPKPDEPTENPTTAPTDPPAAETVDIAVKVKWDDSSNAAGKRPTEVPVKLMANGNATSWKGSIKDDGNGKWEIKFRGRPKTDDNGEIAYSIEIDKNEKAYQKVKDLYSFRVDGSASAGFTVTATYIGPAPEQPPEQPSEPVSEPDPAPEENSAQEPETNPAPGVRWMTDQTRKYTPEQRAKFDAFKTAVKELTKAKKSADTEAKKARNGKNNSLRSTSAALLDKLNEVQTLAIDVAKIFGYTKVANFTVPCAPTDVGRSSAWAYMFWNNSKINEIKVNFN